MADEQPFTSCLHVHRFTDATYFAGPLFQESFRSAFPTPPVDAGWAQYVAFYRWPDDALETVGFCNYLPFGTLWLEGGLCVRRSFYSRLGPTHSAQCRALGGVAQLIMEAAARDLDECDAWFAYIGDARSLKVCTRVGYESTGHEYVKAKWFRALPDQRRAELIERVVAIGPF